MGTFSYEAVAKAVDCAMVEYWVDVAGSWVASGGQTDRRVCE